MIRHDGDTQTTINLYPILVGSTVFGLQRRCLVCRGHGDTYNIKWFGPSIFSDSQNRCIFMWTVLFGVRVHMNIKPFSVTELFRFL